MATKRPAPSRTPGASRASSCAASWTGVGTISPTTDAAPSATATGRSFATLYRGWSVSLFLDAIAPDAPAGRVPPRAARVLPDGPAEEIVLDGTSTHYAIVEGAPGPGVEVEVSGPKLKVPVGARIALLIAVVVTIGVGLVPEPLAHTTRTAVRMTAPHTAPSTTPDEVSAGS